MKITILGNCGPYPKPGGACSGYLLESDDVKILLDCGNGTLSRLRQIIHDLNELDLIILTHLHSDHISDAMILRYALGMNKIKGNIRRSIPLYAPSTPSEDFEKLQFKDAYIMKKIEENLQFHYKGISIAFKMMDHSIPCYGVEILSSGKKFVYSADTKYCDAIVELSNQADLLLCESGVLEKDKTKTTPHLSAKEAGEIAKMCGVKKLLLTHFWPEYDIREIFEEAQKSFDQNLELAVEMKTYEF